MTQLNRIDQIRVSLYKLIDELVGCGGISPEDYKTMMDIVSKIREMGDIIDKEKSSLSHLYHLDTYD